MLRTHTCGELRKTHVGQKVTLCGWVRRVRDIGGLVFIDLRDRYGRTQIVLEAESPHINLAKSLSHQDVICVVGTVRARPTDMVNPKMPTGEIEVVLEDLRILNRSKTPPFMIEDEAKVQEETRLRYRFLDLRRPFMQRNLEIRHRAALSVRNFLSSKKFLEIETPFLTKSTPEGARDFLVPSRIHPGKFYALPQSPQIYKQILMIAGYDRYFQIVRCFRDEDLRADRQPEFTQIDLEMSFVDVDDIIELTEEMMVQMFRDAIGVEVDRPFQRMDYYEAMRRFGIDKPDLRYGMELIDLTDLFEGTEHRIVAQAVSKGDRVVALPVPADLSRKEIENLTELAKAEGAGGLLWFKFKDGKPSGQMAKFLPSGWLDVVKPQSPATFLMVLGKDIKAHGVLGKLRVEVAQRLGLVRQGEWKFLWVVNFPLFEWNEDENRIEPAHHMFTMPFEQDIPKLETEPLQVRAKHYDLVLNGVELGSGSIRIHDRELQEKVMEIIGLPKEERERRFGFLLTALEYGAPPHGGIALGFDRIVAMMAGMGSIRDVIAFPKTTAAQALFEGAPSEVPEDQLAELHIKVVK
ncbi:MAG: aspartate--tRNA ligase [Candidatus Hydrothermota bacterium]|nr:MAG: aspartate--tRNA ligase [Candidatus Hydrothermae bacterium]